MTTHNRSKYRELPPPQSLLSQIVCFWTQEIDTTGGPYSHPILPDGCADIVWIGDMEPMVAGPASIRILAELPAGTVINGARFQPGLAADFLGLPANELLNQHVPLTDISNTTAKRLSEHICKHQSETSKLNAIAEALISQLKSIPHIDTAIRACIIWLVQHPVGRIADLSLLTGLSNRQIRRKFRAAVGYSPKIFQRIIRFQRFLMLSRHSNTGHPTLAKLSYKTGYADQAHMCREVKALAGETPQALLENSLGSTLAMSDLFNTKEPKLN